MTRTSTQGLLLSILATLVPGCGDEDGVCQLDVCGTGCVNLNADPLHCGQCFNECGTNEACQAGTCEPTELVCDTPEIVCGDVCANTQTSAEHCGTCDAPCGFGADCVAGACEEYLISLRTMIESKGDIDRDVFTVKNGTFELTRLGNTLFPGSRIVDHAVLPDGRVLLIGAQETEDVFELFLSSPDGGALTKLSGGAGRVLPGLAVSADGSKVLYRADEDLDEQLDLYAVAIENPGASLKVNGAIVPGGQVSRVFALSADGTRATYIADEDQVGIDELYTVDLSQAIPGPSVKLNPAIANTDTDVFDFVATPDHSRVLYRCNETVNINPQLFVVDLAAAGTAKLITNTSEPDYRAAEDYSLTSDGASAIYTGSQNFHQDSMWISALDVATPVSAFLAENVDGNNGLVRTAKAVAGGAVFFRKGVDFSSSELMTVDLATPNTIVPVFDNTLLQLTVDRVVVSPNGQHLVFGAGGDGGESGNDFRGTEDPNTFGRSFELYHIALPATFPAVPTRLAVSNNKGNGIEHDYIVRNDGSVIFRADLESGGTTEVFISNPAAPDVAVKISPALDNGTEDATDVRQIRSF